jgi:hypothetical protein
MTGIQREVIYKNQKYLSLKEAERITGISRYLIKKHCIFLNKTGKDRCIKCNESGVVYKNLLQCREHLKGFISHTNIINILKGRKKSCNGLSFCYTYDIESKIKVLPEIKHKKYWYTDGINNIFEQECPKGFRKGRTLFSKNNEFVSSLIFKLSERCNLLYLKRYLNICSRGYDRGLKKERGFHIHHIIPKSLSKSDNSTNLTKLTYREHYLAHYLLYKAFPSPKTAYCWINMNTLNRSKYLNSRLFSKTQEGAYKKRSESGYGVKVSESKKNAQKKLSPTEKERISIATKEAMKKVPREKLCLRKNYMWIKNPFTKENKSWLKEKPLPEGWIKGRFRIGNQGINFLSKNRT